MCFKMLVPYIILEISLVVLSKVKGEINPYKEKLFVQYKHSDEASGWYEKLNDDLFMRNEEFNSAKYVFQRTNDVWMLLAYPRNGSIYESDLIYSTEQSMASLEELNYTNYKHTLEYRLPQAGFHSDEITTLQSLVKSKNKKREMHLNDRFKDDSEDLSNENESYEPVKGFYETKETEDILKLFHPKKCSCTKLEIRYNGIPFREYYRSDINRNLSDYCNLSNIQEYSTENRNLSFNNKNNNIPYSEEWEAEVYVSDICQFIYFDRDEDKWVAELQNYCSAQEGGIFSMIWSQDSAPCIEYLPPPPRQTWLYYSSITVFDKPEILDAYYDEKCGGYFKKSIYKDFTVTCASMPDGLS